MRAAHPDKEIEVRPLLGERPSWDRVRAFIQQLKLRGDFRSTETWMLRLTGHTPRPVDGALPAPMPRLTITIPSPDLVKWVTQWTTKNALKAWVAAHPSAVQMDRKEVVVRNDDLEWPLRTSVARETVEHPENFDWNQLGQIRFLRRHSFEHTSGTYRIDLSMVRDAKWSAAFPIADLAKGLQGELHGEAEIEILAHPTEATSALVARDLRNLLETLTQTIGMVPRSEAKEALLAYLEMVAPNLVPAELRDTPAHEFAGAIERKTRGKPRQWFVGYDVTGMNLEHLQEPSDMVKAPTKPQLLDRRTPMVVTEKADGERHLLLSLANGRVYLINNRLQVTTPPLEALPKGRECLLDGEYLADRKLFLAFDCLFDAGADVRKEPFWVKEEREARGRYVRLRRLVDGLRPSDGAAQGARLRLKFFFPVVPSTPTTLLAKAHQMWTQRKTEYDYEIDGLIFVGADRPYHTLTPGQERAAMTDPWVLKWKPSHLLTIDFLVMNPREVPLLAGQAGSAQKPMTEVELYTGMSYRLPQGSHYIAAPFAHSPKTLLPALATVGPAPEPIPTPCVVEFQYDASKPDGQRWIPLRVRHDKTQLHRSDQRRLGRLTDGAWVSGMGANNERVAHDVWRAIQSTVLGREDLFLAITRPEVQDEIRAKRELLDAPLPEHPASQDGRYYAVQEKTKEERERSLVIALRRFHNRVKQKLITAAVQLVRPITSVTKGVPRVKAFDLGAGRGGDLEKYQAAGITYLAALEVSAKELDELNQRYLQLDRKMKAQGGRAFRLQRFHADMRRRLSTGAAALAVESPQAKAVELELYNFFRTNEFSMHMVTSMFAMHYAFDSERSRWSFLHNIYETLQIEGVFVGVAFDGARLMEALEKSPKNELAFVKDEKTFARIVKAYDQPALRPFGQAIDFQFDTITADEHDARREYLIDFNLLEKDLDRVYDIRPVSDEQAQEMGLPAATGPLSDFSDLGFEDLCDAEAAFSQFYRYVVYQKQGPGNMAEVAKIEKLITAA